MNGICSATPAPVVTRLLVGALLLFEVQAGFLFLMPGLPASIRLIVGLIGTIGGGALALAVHGVPAAPDGNGMSARVR